jgi:hypothetical protein
MKKPNINTKTFKITGAGFLALAILLAILFATPILGGGPGGQNTVDNPTISGEFGTIDGQTQSTYSTN